MRMFDRPGQSNPLMRFPLLSLVAWLILAMAWSEAAPARGEARSHWAFLPPQRTSPPAVRKRTWPRNPLDCFILARLEKEGVDSSPEADRVTLIRRLTLDLTGLPPTIAEVDAFLADRREEAYERLVERLLASPHYGERWGRVWLDVARYADSNGYSIDAPRSMWKYRDWVIAALNRDQPFDQFALEQLAGDLLPNATVEQKVATGFHRNTQVNQEGGIDPEQFRVESVMDRVATTATAFLGVTLACAQCHDHKFDPFTQRDYYQFYAFFNNTIEDGHGKGAPEGMLEIPGENEAPENRQKELDEAEGDLDRYLGAQANDLARAEAALSAEQISQLKREVQKILQTPVAERTKKQKRTLYAVLRPDDPDFQPRYSKILKLEKSQTKPVTTLVMMEREKPRETTILIKGDFTRPGAPVLPDVPAIFKARNGEETSSLPIETAAKDPSSRRLNRLDLARWIVSTNNVLTARVTVNRLWQHYFGRGLVETENDFGTQGSPPSHPELLDWLACELMNPNEPNGRHQASAPPWSLKHIHRLIVTSSTYRQSSKARPELATLDPNNKWLARQNRLRLDAEIVRDVCLEAAGLLNPKIGGPSVFPPQPEGVMNLGQSRREWKPSRGPERYRRGLYTFFWRATPYPALMVFDGADGFSTCTRRLRSNTPLQALTLLNDEAFHECAQGVAARVLRESAGSDSARLEQAFRLCLARRPVGEERRRLLALLGKERTSLRKVPAEAVALAGSKHEAGFEPIELGAWTTVTRVLLNLDETITRE